MSRFISKRFSKLEEYIPGEQPKNFDYVKLNTNESPYEPSPLVIAQVSGEEVKHLNLYSDPTCSNLRKKISEYYDVNENNVILGNGSDEILSFCFMAFCDDKTQVVFPDITYGFYEVYANLYNIKYEKKPINEDFTIKTEDYLNTGKTIFIANPNAPTGISLSLDNIEKIIIENPNNIVVIDEAYVDFGGVSAILLTKKYDNLIVVQTFSKSRSLAGGRLGYAIANEKLIGDLNKLRNSTNPYNINRLTLIAGAACIDDSNYYKKMNEQIKEIREYTKEKLVSRDFFVTNSKANFLFVTHNTINAMELYENLKSRKILVRHFNQPRIDNYLRITIGTKKQMDLLINEIDNILRDYE